MVSDFSPDFVGIGAEKAATDWVAACLREHPEVCFSKHKELAFFCELDQHFLKVPYRQYQRGIQWYERQFRHCPAEKVKGEYTPTYLYSREVARRIHRHYPDAKLLVCLRDPVRRAFSQYLHDTRIGLIRGISFEQALAQHHSYVEKGLYSKYLSHYLEFFPSSNMLLLLVEDIKADKRAVVRALYQFLGLNDSGFVPPSLDTTPNAASRAPLSWLNYVLIHAEYFLRERRLDFLLNLLEDTGLRRAAVVFGCRTNRRPLAPYPPMQEDTEKRLRGEFAQDIDGLEKLLNRDLSHWKP